MNKILAPGCLVQSNRTITSIFSTARRLEGGSMSGKLSNYLDSADRKVGIAVSLAYHGIEDEVVYVVWPHCIGWSWCDGTFQDVSEEE